MSTATQAKAAPKTSGRRPTSADIQTWLRYWQVAGMVAVDRIRAFDQVHTARKFCSCMRVGLFNEDDVSDLMIWRALTDMREPAR